MRNDLFYEISCVWICIIHIGTEKIYCFYLDLVLLLNVKREKEGNEKFKDDAYNIDHGFRPKSL